MEIKAGKELNGWAEVGIVHCQEKIELMWKVPPHEKDYLWSSLVFLVQASHLAWLSFMSSGL